MASVAARRRNRARSSVRRRASEKTATPRLPAPAAARPDDRRRSDPACGLARPLEIRDAPAGAGEGGGARLLEALPSRLPHGLLVAAGRFHLMPRRHFSTKCKGPTSRVGPLRRLAKTRALLGLALLL